MVPIEFVSRFLGKGEITLSPSLAANNGDVLGESHADMTTVGDTTNRDDADCLTGGAAWSNGIHSIAEEIGDFTIANGSGAARCTELSWTIDTSQAQEGTTYRFVTATKDAWDPDKGIWRGPIAITEYPTVAGYKLVIRLEQNERAEESVIEQLLKSANNAQMDRRWICNQFYFLDRFRR